MRKTQLLPQLLYAGSRHLTFFKAPPFVPLSRPIVSSRPPLVTSMRDIFSCFPGNAKELEEAIAESSSGNITVDSAGISTLASLVKGKVFPKKQLITWRSALQKYPDFETNPDLMHVIGALALGSSINHIAFIPDGCRRWAVNRNLFPAIGHKAFFVEKLPALITESFDFGVHTFSISCTSQNNFITREENQLIDLLVYIERSMDICFSIAQKRNIRISYMGNKKIDASVAIEVQKVFYALIEKIDFMEHTTKHYSQHRVNFSINYNGEDDLQRAIQKMHRANIDFEQMQDGILSNYTDMSDQVYRHPNLLIRTASTPTGGRVGGLFSIEVSDTHLFFTPKLAPEVHFDTILQAAASAIHPLSVYRSREHRTAPEPSSYSTTYTFRPITDNPLTNPFDSKIMAKYYRTGRLSLHTEVIEQLARDLNITKPVALALDVACGTGQSSIALKRIATRIIAIDSSLSMLEHAERDACIEYKQASAESLPFEDNSFDLISISSAFHWLDQAQFLKEAGRVLRDTGQLIIYDFRSPTIKDSKEFSDWHETVFSRKYPYVPGRNKYSPERNQDPTLLQAVDEKNYTKEFTITLEELKKLCMTTSGIFNAVEKQGESPEEIEAWLTKELEKFFVGVHAVHFLVDVSVVCLKRVPRPELRSTLVLSESEMLPQYKR